MKRVMVLVRAAVALSLVVGGTLGVRDWVVAQTTDEPVPAARAVQATDSGAKVVSFAVPAGS